MKILYNLLVIIIIVETNGALRNIINKNLISNEIENSEILLHKDTYVKHPIWFTIRSGDVAYPQYYENSDFTITKIVVIDNSITNHYDGSLAEIDYGGVGFKYANIHLRSERGEGYNFTVEIYGEK